MVASEVSGDLVVWRFQGYAFDKFAKVLFDCILGFFFISVLDRRKKSVKRLMAVGFIESSIHVDGWYLRTPDSIFSLDTGKALQLSEVKWAL